MIMQDKYKTNLTDSLKEFIGRKTNADGERNTQIVWSYKDTRNRIDICVVFHRCDSIMETHKEYVLDDKTKYVLVIPSFWISIPDSVSISYIMTFIEMFYEDINIDTTDICRGTAPDLPCAPRQRG